MYREPLKFTSEQVVEYLRKSRSDDPSMTVDEVLQRHEKILNEYAVREFGSTVPDNQTYREVASSETIDGRPEMLKLLKRIESPKTKAVLVVEAQRLSRGDLEDAGRLIKLLRYTNTIVLTPQRQYDLQDEYDRDAFERELKRGNEYLEYFKKIQARGRLQSVMEGNYIGSVPPYGYDKTTVVVNKKKCPTLQENKDQADIVRMIFDLFVQQDMGITMICRHLDSIGVRPQKGKYWSPETVRGLLANEHYIGKVRWNWRKGKLAVIEQEVVRSRPRAAAGDYIVADGKHAALVPLHQFAAAQEKLGRRARRKPGTKVRNPLAGILHCRCGRAMSLRVYKNRRSEDRLICDGQVHCNTGSSTYTEVMDRICDALELYIEDFKVKLGKDEDSNATLQESIITSLERQLQLLEEKEIKQWEKYSEEGMPKAVFEKLNNKVVREKEQAKIALREAKENLPEKVMDYEQRIVRFSEALTALRDPDVPAEDKNKYLKRIIDRIDYYRERPVRITKENCSKYGIGIDDLKTGGNWYAPPFELDIKLRV